MLDPQNFTVYANGRVIVPIDVDPSDGVDLENSVVVWRVYEQALGMPTDGVPPVISKSSDDGIEIQNPTAPSIEVTLEPSDTVNLLRNYYHECTVQDPDRGTVTVANGIMTVLGTENRDLTT